jgi:hypothetical protein
MRAKNAISGVLMLVLGFSVGSAVAMLMTAPSAGIHSSKLSQGPAILTLDLEHHRGCDTGPPLEYHGDRHQQRAASQWSTR